MWADILLAKAPPPRQRRLPICLTPGERFGRLTTVAPTSRRGGVWRCLCDCGQETKSRAFDLRHGRKRSCGCLLVDTQRELMTARHRERKGGA